MAVKKDGSTMNWTEKELEVLRRLYPLYGPSWCGWKDVLAGRSMYSLRTKASKIGVHGPSSRLSWNKYEEDAVRAHFPVMGPNWWGWSILLENRSARSISEKASMMGVKFVGRKEQPKWTNAQRRRLVLKMKELVGSTGHSMFECIDEYVRLRRESKDLGRVTKDNGGDDE